MGTNIVFLVLKQLELDISLDEVYGYNICKPYTYENAKTNTFPKNVMVKIERNIQLAKESGKYKTKPCMHGDKCKFGDRLCIFSHHGAKRLPF
jgi:hypothetical protein